MQRTGVTGPTAAAAMLAAAVIRDSGYCAWSEVPTANSQVADIALGVSQDEASANARLIAAAPELLLAAQLVLAWFEAEDDHSKADFYQRMQMCRDAESAVCAAIAKATGAAS